MYVVQEQSEKNSMLQEHPSYLTWGDASGGLGVIVFKKQPLLTKIAALPADLDKKVFRDLRYGDVTGHSVKGVKSRYLANVHRRIVNKVKQLQ